MLVCTSSDGLSEKSCIIQQIYMHEDDKNRRARQIQPSISPSSICNMLYTCIEEET